MAKKRGAKMRGVPYKEWKRSEAEEKQDFVVMGPTIRLTRSQADVARSLGLVLRTVEEVR